MEIDKKTASAFSGKNYVKPKMEFGNHIWDWASHTYGIREYEKNELKFFIKNAIPILGYYLNEIKRLEKVAENNRKLDKRQLEEDVYIPFLRLLSSSKQKGPGNVVFTMEFTWDGHIFVDREEDVFIRGESFVRQGQKTHTLDFLPFHLRWQLGELFYDEEALLK